MIFAATNGEDGLIWSRLTPSPIPGSHAMVYSRGPWYMVAVIYDAALGVAGAFLLGRAALRAHRVFVWQTSILLVGLLIPWIGSVVYLLPSRPFHGLNLPPICFALTGLLILVGISRFRLLDLVPVARDRLVEKMSDGLVVLDEQDRVVDLNPAARALFAGSASMIGRRLSPEMGPLGAALRELRARGDEHREVSLPGEPDVCFDLRTVMLVDRAGEATGCLLVIRDMTEHRRLEIEREELIAELRAALADVKTLSGLLPICSSCKKIRDDQGYWMTLERYLTEHSSAQFSHGLCDECARRLYPGLTDGPAATP